MVASNRMCPTCATILDDETYPDDMSRTASPGDLTICVYCASVLIFTEVLGLRLMTDKEMAEMPEGQRKELDKTLKLVATPPPKHRGK